MRVRIIWFVFGAIVTLWADAYMAEVDVVDVADVAVWAAVVQWFDGGGIDFNHDVIEDALEPQSGEDAEPLEDVPDADWYNKATPPIRPA